VTQGYPPDEPLWAEGEGAPALARLHDSRMRRLARLAGHLATHGVDLDAGLAADSPAALAAALDDYTYAQWPAVADEALDSRERWRAPRWDDQAAPLYTLILDLGVALGALAIRHRPTLAWGVFDDPDLAAEGDERFMTVMPLGPYRPDGSGPVVPYNALDEAFMRYQAIAFRALARRRERFLDALTLALDAGKPR